MGTTVYESFIEITLQPVFDDIFRRDEAVQRELSPVYDLYHATSNRAPTDAPTQQQALIELFWHRASTSFKVARVNGYIGSYHNCVLEVVYGIFAADILKFLFGKRWVPQTTVEPFHPEIFLARLSALERAAMKLKDGAKTPIQLPELTPYIQSGLGPQLKRFNEKRHRVLLDYSLRELRDFGELAVSLQRNNENPTVEIQIYSPYGHSQEILRFASEENNPGG